MSDLLHNAYARENQYKTSYRILFTDTKHDHAKKKIFFILRKKQITRMKNKHTHRILSTSLLGRRRGKLNRRQSLFFTFNTFSTTPIASSFFISQILKGSRGERELVRKNKNKSKTKQKKKTKPKSKTKKTVHNIKRKEAKEQTVIFF